MARCQEKPHFRYTWPGKDESFICFEHARQLQYLAATTGFRLQLIPLSEDEQAAVSCSQEVCPNSVPAKKRPGHRVGFDGSEGLS